MGVVGGGGESGVGGGGRRAGSEAHVVDSEEMDGAGRRRGWEHSPQSWKR